MKTIVALGFSIVLLTFIGCSQQASEELSGTWINMEYKDIYDPEESQKQKVVFHADGKFESFKATSESKADYKAVYKIEEKWTDKDGNIWYKYRMTEKSWDWPDTFYLSKISDSGKVKEYQSELEYFPKKIDPSRAAYRKYNRE